jgi:hypothetical protein
MLKVLGHILLTVLTGGLWMIIYLGILLRRNELKETK